MLDTSDPQQMNAYAYGENNPETFSDPTGTRTDDCMGWGSAAACNNYAVSHFRPKYWPTYIRTHPENFAGVSEAARQAALRAAQLAALQRLWATQQKQIEVKRKLASALGSLLKIAADELGITAGIDCFAHGDIGACGETALNALGYFAGGLLSKFAAKYAAPWKWAKAAKLIGAVTRLVGTVTKAIKDLLKIGDEIGEAERAVKATCAVNSFVPGTLVLLANGKPKPIERIKTGDKVLATDPSTGRTLAEPVVATIVGVGAKDLVTVTVGTAGKRRKAGAIVTTAGHPFWSPATQAWVPASALAPGASVRDANGKTLRVLSVHSLTQFSQANNLTVADLHTYYVEAGATPVLVHNCRPPWIGPGTLPADEEKALDATLGHMDAGTMPSDATAKKWGTPFKNWNGDLPGAQGAESPYREYRVAPTAGTDGAGPLRVVQNAESGDTYYTWTHYGDSGDPPFVRIR